jgi:hypothetical protein
MWRSKAGSALQKEQLCPFACRVLFSGFSAKTIYGLAKERTANAGPDSKISQAQKSGANMCEDGLYG